MTPTTRILPCDEEGITAAAMYLARGRLVAIPTETVYGLAADARQAEAVAAIYAAKGRPSFNPLIVHVADLAAAGEFAHFHDEADALARAMWPGPLTLVLPVRAGSGLAGLVTAGLETVALRVPAHPVARAVIAAFGGAVAAPSANPSGRISPTRAAHVMAGLEGKIAAVLDAGPCEVGVESTILGWPQGVAGRAVELRAGGAPPDRIKAVLGYRPAPARPPADPAQPLAPGQLASHYAPRASLRMNARSAEGDEYLLGFGEVSGEATLSARGCLTEAAARLFEALHEADATGRPIAVAPIPDTGLGRAINDRLARAAAPRG